MPEFKEDYHRTSTEKEIDKAIESLKRAKKYGTKKNDFNVAFFNIANTLMRLKEHHDYIKEKYPEEY